MNKKINALALKDTTFLPNAKVLEIYDNSCLGIAFISRLRYNMINR